MEVSPKNTCPDDVYCSIFERSTLAVTDRRDPGISYPSPAALTHHIPPLQILDLVGEERTRRFPWWGIDPEGLTKLGINLLSATNQDQMSVELMRGRCLKPLILVGPLSFDWYPFNRWI